MGPRGLDELFPDWKQLDAPLTQPVASDRSTSPSTPETRYCPGGVYEFVKDAGVDRLQINAQNLRALQGVRHQGPRAKYRVDPPQCGEIPVYVGI